MLSPRARHSQGLRVRIGKGVWKSRLEIHGPWEYWLFGKISVTAVVPWLRSYFRLAQDLSGEQNEKRP